MFERPGLGIGHFSFALALYRAADERLYARKVARGYRRGPELGTATA